MKVPQQNSLLIQHVRQNCPTSKSQCNADNAHSKGRGYGGGCALRTGKEGPETESTDGHWERCPYQPDRTRLLGPAHCSELSHAHMCDGHRDEEKTHWKNSQWVAGIRDNFSSQDLAGRGNGTVLSVSLRTGFRCSPRSAASCRTTLCCGTGRGAAAHSSSALQLPLFLRFVRIESHFVSKLRVLCISKVSEIILNTASVRADGNSEMQTRPLARGFFHCMKQGQHCCSHEARQCSLCSVALNLLLTDGAGNNPFPGNHLKYLPLCFKPLENPEAHMRRIQDFFLITRHLQLSS